MSPGDTSPNLNELISDLVHKGEMNIDLHSIALSAAKRLLAGELDQRGYEAEDLAMDFLLYLYEAGNDLIQTKAGLSTEMRRYLVRTRTPETHELWTILSEALRGLEKDEKVRRLSAQSSRNNTNMVLWTSADPEADGDSLDMANFSRLASEVGHFSPAGRKDQKILSPSQARELALALLSAAGCPVQMRHLCDEARKHVVLMGKILSDTDRSVPDQGDSRIERTEIMEAGFSGLMRLEKEADHKAKSIWVQVNEIGEEKTLCLYVLPKYFLGKKVTLSDIGRPQRVSEAAQVVMSAIAREMRIERLSGEKGSDVELLLRELADRVTRALMRKCSEKGMNCYFIEDNDREPTDADGSELS